MAGYNLSVLCETACAPQMPLAIPGSCNIITRPGGIDKIFAISCDLVMTSANFVDRAFWAAAIASGDIVASNLLLGSKAESDVPEIKTSSRRPAGQSTRTEVVNFTDFGRYDTNGIVVEAADIKFWNNLQLNSTSRFFAVLTSSGHLMGKLEGSLVASEVIDEDIKGTSKIVGKLSWNMTGMTEGVKVTGFETL